MNSMGNACRNIDNCIILFHVFQEKQLTRMIQFRRESIPVGCVPTAQQQGRAVNDNP